MPLLEEKEFDHKYWIIWGASTFLCIVSVKIRKEWKAYKKLFAKVGI